MTKFSISGPEISIEEMIIPTLPVSVLIVISELTPSSILTKSGIDKVLATEGLPTGASSPKNSMFF